MAHPRSPFGDLGVLLLLALARLTVHCLTNGQYGFHRDELAVLDDARHLAWGYVAYPPLTPFLARVALEVFGALLVGVRLLSALALSVSMVLIGLMARELGGGRWAHVVAALAAAVAPMSLIMGALCQYISFDYLWWVLIAFLMIRLLKSSDPRWWLAIGAAIGLGLLTKYTIVFCIAGVVVGVLLTPARRDLRSPWLWGAIAISVLIFLPNLIWQMGHGFISLDFLSSIHARDIELGRTEGFLAYQALVSASPFTLPLWLAGLAFFLRAPAGERYRALGWMYVVPLVLFAVMRGRFYYLAPAYPMLFAAGAVVAERWLSRHPGRPSRLGKALTWAALALGAVLGAALMLPIAPINSAWWEMTSKVHDNFAEEIGWPELVEEVAEIYAGRPEEEKPVTGILAGNYGEAGALNLYGLAYGLPTAISGVNSYWLRGHGHPPPQVVIALGFSREQLQRFFARCDLAGHVSNRYGVLNEETRFHPDIFVCRDLREPWPEFWKRFRRFG